MLSARTSEARAAVSYSIRHRVFSRSGISRRVSSRSTAGRPTARVSSRCSVWRSAPAGNAGAGYPFLAHQARNEATAARRWFHVAGYYGRA